MLRMISWSSFKHRDSYYVPYYLQDEKSEVEKVLSSVKKEVSNIRQSMLDIERKSSSSQGQSYDKLKSQLDKLMDEDKEKTSQMKDLMETLEAIKIDNSVGFSGSFGKTDIDHIRSGISRKGGGPFKVSLKYMNCLYMR